MKTIQFKKVKENAKHWVKSQLQGANMTPAIALEFVSRILSKTGTDAHIYTLVVDIHREANKIIDRWDIRAAQSLIEISKDFQPKWLKLNCTADMDENGNWILIS